MESNKSLVDLINKASVHQRADLEQFLRSFLRFLFLAIPVVGLGLNSLALKVLSGRAAQDQHRFNHGAGLPLAAMTIADQLCLSSYFCWMVMFSEWGLSIAFEAYTKTVICKVLLYIVHSTSAFSLWCWALLSYFRYFAVYKPVKYQTMTSEPRLAVGVVIAICFVLEGWILATAVYEPTQNVCTEQLSRLTSSIAHVSEMTWTYFLPMVLIAILDLKVLCRQSNDTEVVVQLRPNKDSLSVNGKLPTSATLRKTSPRLMTKQNPTLRKEAVMFLQEKRWMSERRDSRSQVNMLYRCLYIALLDLAMNLPSYCLRLYSAIFYASPFASERISYYAESVSELLYFSQFCMNAIYLAIMVYQAPADSRRNTMTTSYRSKQSTIDSAHSSCRSVDQQRKRRELL
uniref:G-protein coupled receptors family 1 profile domain-containing protein n=1 Tax=Plectus sambesii TaxID=2011161 RepID=A0A914XMR4_9BILA